MSKLLSLQPAVQQSPLFHYEPGSPDTCESQGLCYQPNSETFTAHPSQQKNAMVLMLRGNMIANSRNRNGSHNAQMCLVPLPGQNVEMYPGMVGASRGALFL